MAGSPLGAALFGLWAPAPFFASALFDALALVCSWKLRLPERAEVKQTKPGIASFMRDLVEGWQWVFASKTIMSGVLIMGLFQFAGFAMHQAINLQLVSTGTDALLISLINVISGVATLAGSLLSSRLCDRIPVGKGVVAILALTTLGYLPLLASAAYPSVVVSIILTGLPMPLFAALVNGFVFSKTPVDRQGRTRAAVMTAIMFFGSGSGALAGELLPRIGFAGFVMSMIGLMVVSVAVAALNPLIRTIPASPHWGEVEL
jgi:predicted MFS family arabinose efflux permease